MAKQSNIAKAATVTPEGMVIDLASKAFVSATDTNREIDCVIGMTPEEGFKLKLQLIADAKDLSTIEKLRAIVDAENKFRNDLAENAKTARQMGWSKCGTVCVGLTGIGFMILFGIKISETIKRMIS